MKVIESFDISDELKGGFDHPIPIATSFAHRTLKLTQVCVVDMLLSLAIKPIKMTITVTIVHVTIIATLLQVAWLHEITTNSFFVNESALHSMPRGCADAPEDGAGSK